MNISIYLEFVKVWSGQRFSMHEVGQWQIASLLLGKFGSNVTAKLFNECIVYKAVYCTAWYFDIPQLFVWQYCKTSTLRLISLWARDCLSSICSGILFGGAISVLMKVFHAYYVLFQSLRIIIELKVDHPSAKQCLRYRKYEMLIWRFVGDLGGKTSFTKCLLSLYLVFLDGTWKCHIIRISRT